MSDVMELLDQVERAGEISRKQLQGILDANIEATDKVLMTHRGRGPVVINQISSASEGAENGQAKQTSKLGKLIKAGTVAAALLGTGGAGAGIAAWILGGDKEVVTEKGSLLQFLEDGGYHVPSDERPDDGVGGGDDSE